MAERQHWRHLILSVLRCSSLAPHLQHAGGWHGAAALRCRRAAPAGGERGGETRRACGPARCSAAGDSDGPGSARAGPRHGLGGAATPLTDGSGRRQF